MEDKKFSCLFEKNKFEASNRVQVQDLIPYFKDDKNIIFMKVPDIVTEFKLEKESIDVNYNTYIIHTPVEGDNILEQIVSSFREEINKVEGEYTYVFFFDDDLIIIYYDSKNNVIYDSLHHPHVKHGYGLDCTVKGFDKKIEGFEKNEL